jgi:hypothetical protein
MIIFLGQPNFAKIFSTKKFMMIESLDSLVGISSTHFVKYYVVVNIHLCWPLEFRFISPMNFKPYCWKGASTLIGLRGNGIQFCLHTNIWHPGNALTNALVLINRLGQ